MTDLLTTKEVQDLLKVDRITVYRMLQDGRLAGVKIGQQWRFHAGEVQRLLSAPFTENARTTDRSNFPSHCVQTIQELFSQMANIGAVTLDLNGDPLTDFSNPGEIYAELLSEPDREQTCRASWREIAQTTKGRSGWAYCQGGLRYRWSVVRENSETVALFLAGPFETKTNLDDRRPIAISGPRQSELATWVEKVTLSIESLLTERAGLVSRLQRISEISQLL
jgi:excisionase family DNA binding protein